MCVSNTPSSDHPECASKMQYNTNVHIVKVRMGTSEGGHQNEQQSTHATQQLDYTANYRKLPMLTNMEEAVSNETYIESNHSNKGPRYLGNNITCTEMEKLSKMAPSSPEMAQANKWRCVCGHT